MRVLVREEDLKGDEEGIFASVEVGLDTKICKLQSWLMRLVRILLVKTTKAYWYLATSLK